MQLLDKDNLIFELRSEVLDDLWVLSQFIVPGDLVFATTERKVKIGGENSTKQVTKLIFVELLVTKSSFESENLRVSGEIQNETEFTTKGQAHTLTFRINDKIKVQKSQLLKFEQKMLDNSLESKKSKNFLVLFDKDELVAVEFTSFSFSVLFEKRNLGSKKYYSQDINENEEKFKILEEFLKREYNTVIFAGPGLWKENLKKYVKDRTGQDITTFNWPDVNSSAASKVIKSINEKGILNDNQLAQENEYIGKLLENINKGMKYVYGYNNTVESVQTGSVEVLLLTTKFMDKKREDGTYLEINDLMRTVEQLNGDLVIVNSKNESGKVLDGLGGIGAILRY